MIVAVSGTPCAVILHHIFAASEFYHGKILKTFELSGFFDLEPGICYAIEVMERGKSEIRYVVANDHTQVLTGIALDDFNNAEYYPLRPNLFMRIVCWVSRQVSL